jgi:hypothetical protein
MFNLLLVECAMERQRDLLNEAERERFANEARRAQQSRARSGQVSQRRFAWLSRWLAIGEQHAPAIGG